MIVLYSSLLGSAGRLWPLPASPWSLLAAPGRSQPLPDVPGCSHQLPDSSGRSQPLPGRPSLPARSRPRLAPSSCSRLLLAALGCFSLLLIAPGCFWRSWRADLLSLASLLRSCRSRLSTCVHSCMQLGQSCIPLIVIFKAVLSIVDGNA